MSYSFYDDDVNLYISNRVLWISIPILPIHIHPYLFIQPFAIDYTNHRRIEEFVCRNELQFYE